MAFHINLPLLMIGLSSWLAVLSLKSFSGGKVHADLSRMRVKIFAISFGMGFVSWVAMFSQFGINCGAFVDKEGDVFGPLLGFEV